MGWAFPRGLTDVVSPPTCAVCGLPGAAVCAACLAGMTPLGSPACARCGCPQPVAVPRCPECRPALVLARQAAVYDGALAAAVTALKDRGRRDVAHHLARLIVARCPPPPPAAVLVPVPLGPRRARLRGFNQSALLAAHLARLWRLPLEVTWLVRVREEPPQRGAGRTTRARQAMGAFAATGPVPACVWLVDDVHTTGATLAAAAAALHRAGARHVGAVTAARAVGGRIS